MLTERQFLQVKVEVVQLPSELCACEGDTINLLPYLHAKKKKASQMGGVDLKYTSPSRQKKNRKERKA